MKYLVIMELDGEKSASLNWAHEIISMIDMTDCTNASYTVYDLEHGEPEKLTIHGCWHDMKHPLYIKLTNARGDVVFDGEGVDH